MTSSGNLSSRQQPQSGVAGAGLAPGYAVRIALFFTALFLVAGAKLPYLPVWLSWRGLSGTEIALITSAPLFLRILAGPLIAMAADWSGNRRLAAMVLSWVSLAGLLALVLAVSFTQILVAIIIMALASTGIMPIAETLAMTGVRRAGLDYGRMRLWGSVSFIVAGFIVGVAIERSGAGAVLWTIVVFAIVSAGVAHALPAEPADTDSRKPEGRPRFSLGQAKALFLERRFLLFLVAAGAVQASHGLFYTFGVIEWQRQGLSSSWAAMLWAVGVVVEIAIFAVSARAVATFGATGLLLLGAGAALVRWTAMAFSPAIPLLIALQALHGLTFGAAHLGALHILARLVPSHAAGTAQALYASVGSGIGLGLATMAAGPLYAAYGGRAYLAMALLAGVSIAAGLALHAIMRQQKTA
ncbi:MAG: MFS transporter [Hyphomicrobiaceae bacterium]